MFSIFEYVILVFPKHSNFRGIFEVIHEEIMQIGKLRTTEELSRLCEDKNEDSKSLRRVSIRRNYVSKFQTKLFEDKNLKTTKIKEI